MGWKHPVGLPAEKSIVASPVVLDNIVYIGGSDHTFRALDAQTGSLLWEYTAIDGFMEARPFIDKEQVVTGSWGNDLYSFHPKTGQLQWVWSNKPKNRMYSPAATWPVKAHGKIFFTTPERICYAVDARTGKTIWKAEGGRESGLVPGRRAGIRKNHVRFSFCLPDRTEAGRCAMARSRRF